VGGAYAQKEVKDMARASRGKKVIPVKSHFRKINGKRVKVKGYKRAGS
jgi:hypothetical protein